MGAPVPRHYRPGQFLFREGEPSQSLFLLKKGTVGIRKMKGTAYVELAKVYANEVLGELAFFDRAPRSASAVALTEVEALELDFAGLDRVYSTVPEYFRTIIASVANRLRKANDSIRRLQRNVITDDGREIQVSPDEELDPATVLAAGPAITEVELPVDGEKSGEKPDDKNPPKK